MLTNIQPEFYQKKVRSELQDVKHNLKLLRHITQQLDSLSQTMSKTQHKVILDKSQKLKVDIRQKLKTMNLNLDQTVSVLDFKMTIICKQLAIIQRNTGNCIFNNQNKIKLTQIQQQHKYQINQLEQRIFDLQKKENQYVKQLSELKERNFKLREDFTNLSFDSNQRIKELSEKLHNNTSPNLTVRRLNGNNNPQASYFQTPDESDRKKTKNNFVKIKGANNFDQQLNYLELTPDPKRNKNILDSFTSQQSEADIKGLGYEIPGYEIPGYENNDGNLKFGCFPGKQQVSQKTKTGSSSQNKKLNLEQKSDKNRRFQFLLNNLMDQKNSREEPASFINPTQSNYNYKGLTKRLANHDEYQSVFDEKAIRRYQI